MSERVNQSLRAGPKPRGLYREHMNSTNSPQGSHQPVRKVCRPDVVISSGLTQPRSQLQDYPESRLHTRKTQPRHGDGPVIIFEEDRQHPDSSNNPNTQRVLNTTYMNTNTPIPTSRRQIDNDMVLQQHDHFLSRHDTYLHQDRMLVDSTKNMPSSVVDHSKTFSHHPEPLDEESTTGSRPRLGPRTQEALCVPKIRISETAMAPKVHLNMTGMDVAQVGEGDEKDTCEEPTEDHESTVKVTSNPLEISSPDTSNSSGLLDVDKSSNGQVIGQNTSTTNHHAVCCPECCAGSDCHDSCLGHPSPNAGVLDSETSSLVSMGIFDANFETSVKAVNKALLTPADKADGKLAKVRTALSWKCGTSSLTKSSPRPNTMKRTLRNETLSQKVNIGLIRPSQPTIQGPRRSDTAQAKTAAVKAQHMADSSRKSGGNPDEARIETTSKTRTSKKTKIDKKEKMGKPTEADKVRHVSNQARKVSKNDISASDAPPSNSSETTLVQSECENEAISKKETKDECTSKEPDSDTLSMLSRVNTFIRKRSFIARPKRIELTTLTSPVLLSHLHSLILVLKDMALTVADTTSVVIVMAIEYNRSGNVVLPVDISASEFAGNLLRSILYLMIAACLYALCLKAGRLVLAILRFVLLPVKICAWIIG